MERALCGHNNESRNRAARRSHAAATCVIAASSTLCSPATQASGSAVHEFQELGRQLSPQHGSHDHSRCVDIPWRSGISVQIRAPAFSSRATRAPLPTPVFRADREIYPGTCGTETTHGATGNANDTVETPPKISN